jgi:hypothetical protein
MAFKITYMYDYLVKLCRTEAEVMLNHANSNIHGTGLETSSIGSEGSMAAVRPFR